MPIYEYQCQSCQHELEALQKVSDAPLEVCPECNERALRKKVSAAAFRLKGGGWYETDFKTGDKKNLAASGADGASDKGAAAASKDSGGSDSKSDSGDKASKSNSGAGSDSAAAG
jgi:putative FmdB family regulatory protein